jgi:hypothetical protein
MSRLLLLLALTFPALAPTPAPAPALPPLETVAGRISWKALDPALYSMSLRSNTTLRRLRAGEGRLRLSGGAEPLTVDVTYVLPGAIRVSALPSGETPGDLDPDDRLCTVVGRRFSGVLRASSVTLRLTEPQLASFRSLQKKYCLRMLKYIDSAAEQWALDRDKGLGAAVTMADLTRKGAGYLDHAPACPAGGTYRVKQTGQAPTCTVHGNLMEEEGP